MNGEEKQYLEEKFDKFEKKLDKTHDAVLRLPCGIHNEKIKGLGVSVDRAWKFIYGIIISVILSGTALVFLRAVAMAK